MRKWCIILWSIVGMSWKMLAYADSTLVTNYHSTHLHQEKKLQFEPNYKDRYKGPEFNYKDKQPNAFERWLQSKSKEKQNTPSQDWSFFFWAIVIIALVFAVYTIIGMLLGKKGNWIFNKKSENRSLEYGLDHDDIHNADFGHLIIQALDAKDYRMAVRYQYLQTLQKLQDKEIVQYHKEKTNADYIYEIKKQTLADAFRYISYIYDHAWYGGFEVTMNKYALAEKAFDETNKMI